MDSKMPAVMLRVFAWILFIVAFLVGFAPIIPGSGYTTSPIGPLFLIFTIPFWISGAVVWAFLLAIAGILEAVLDIRDELRADREPAPVQRLRADAPARPMPQTTYDPQRHVTEREVRRTPTRR